MRRTRVLIVDDSPLMRRMISSILDQDPEIEVVGAAADAYEAREAIKAHSPDVLTLDVELPKMSGIEFLRKIMRLRPMPVVMVSSLTQEGATTAIEALTIGAVECVAKPAGGDIAAAFGRLAEIVKAAAKAPVATLTERGGRAAEVKQYLPNGRILAIGSSTGGVDAISTILSAFPANCPPTVITQHMPPNFTRSLAKRLTEKCAPTIAEARDGAVLRPGFVYIAPGGDHHLEISGRGALTCRLTPGGLVSGHRPSVDKLFTSVARLRDKAVGVILTGMGRDGADGLLKIRQAGGKTIGQDEASCVVYGMPRVAHEIGAVERQAPLSKISEFALGLCGTIGDSK